MQILRQSTQVIVRVGPFVDVGDGFTPQTDITLAGNEAELLKNASVEVDISGRTWTAVANCRGWYDLTLTTDDTDTVGLLTVVVQDDSDCLPVFRDFQVMDTAPFDEMFKDAAAGMQGVIEVNNLDHLLKVTTGVAADGDLSNHVVDQTVMSHLLTATADTDKFKASTDSLEAIKVHADTIKAETAVINAFWNVFILTAGTIGAVGNDTTHLHLTGQTYGDDELNDYIVVIYDNSETKYHSAWITDWDNASALATVATLPFTPQDSTDAYWVFALRKHPSIASILTEVGKIGTIPALDGAGQTIGAAIAKLADDNGGADFDAGTDSLQKIRDRGDAAWTGPGASMYVRGAGYLGDYKEGETIYFTWYTNTVPSVDGSVKVYKDDGTDEVTVPTGITDSRDFDGETGVHHCTIDLSANTFYATGGDYLVVLSAATIGGVTVNTIIASFSIENRFLGGWTKEG